MSGETGYGLMYFVGEGFTKSALAKEALLESPLMLLIPPAAIF